MHSDRDRAQARTEPFVPASVSDRTRPRLEARLIATAGVLRAMCGVSGLRPLVRRLDRDTLSPSAWSLLQQLLDLADLEWVRGTTKAQRALLERAGALTVDELLEYTEDELLVLLGRHLERVTPPASWERALAIATRADS